MAFDWRRIGMGSAHLQYSCRHADRRGLPVSTQTLLAVPR
jgi:hypothetical protein